MAAIMETPAKAPAPGTPAAKARAVARDYEAVFLTQMFSSLFSSLGKDGPLGGGGTQGIYRSLLAEEYGRSVAAAGGIGLTDTLARELLSLQEARAS